VELATRYTTPDTTVEIGTTIKYIQTMGHFNFWLRLSLSERLSERL